jgi:predicted ribosomally synthesized peptide with SipW-like signal peptide
MKKILASTLVVVSLIATVGGATFAVFSDSEEIMGNTIAAGSVDIDLVLENGEEYSEFDKPINATGLLPGEWSPWARVAANNNSEDTPLRLYFYVKNLVGGACDKTNLMLKTGAEGGNELQYEIYNSVIEGLEGNNNRVEITGPQGVWDPSLPAGESAVIWQRAQLDLSADNDYQNQSCTWTEVFVAESAPAEDDDNPVSFPVSFPEED